MIQIRPIRKTDPARKFLDFICELIDERVYIKIDEKPTLEWEQKWLGDLKKKIRYKETVWLGAWEGKKLIASAHAERRMWNEKNNIAIGISVLKDYRGKGLGEKLLRMIIELAKKKLKPKNIYLSVAVPNLPAISLYKKVGFRQFARFPNWIRHGNRYFDVLYMILK